jgi:hypothetical protein
MSDNNPNQQRSVPAQVDSTPLEQAIAKLTELYRSAVQQPNFYGSIKLELVFQGGRLGMLKASPEQTIKIQ